MQWFITIQLFEMVITHWLRLQIYGLSIVGSLIFVLLSVYPLVQGRPQLLLHSKGGAQKVQSTNFQATGVASKVQSTNLRVTTVELRQLYLEAWNTFWDR